MIAPLMMTRRLSLSKGLEWHVPSDLFGRSDGRKEFHSGLFPL